MTVLPGLIDCHNHMANHSYDMAASIGCAAGRCRRVAMRLTSVLCASLSIGLAVALLAGVPAEHNAGQRGGRTGIALAAESSGGAAGEGAFRHLRALQDIATANGGNRAAGTPGYDRSAEYVADRLKEAGYAVRFEEFDFPFFEERTAPVLLVSAPDRPQEPAPAGPVRTLANSGSGDVSAPLRAVRLGLEAGPPSASNSGCEARDFDGFELGAVALVRRGTCTFQTKVGNAAAAGPVVGVSYELGRSLDARAGTVVRLAVDAVRGKRRTRNVLADTAGDGEDPRIVVGAHLDSVPEGPGINDNGSGSAAVLEAALQLAPQARRGVRIGFWGAEERGLIGSHHHVGALSEEARRRIALYLNLDMVGSPNFVRFVQSSAATGELPAIARRELLADIRQRGLAVDERSGGRYGTDDASFSEKGIPTVGLYTGAGGSKSVAEAGSFGGTAGRPYDPCYHRACDTIENINRGVLDENTRALLRALNAVATAAAGTSSIIPP
jgi:hypothetical protein